MLRRIFRPKREEVAGGRRRLHNEELNNVEASWKIIRMVKSRRKKWRSHVARMEEGTNAYNILVGRPEEHSDNLEVDGNIIET